MLFGNGLEYFLTRLADSKFKGYIWVKQAS